MKKMLSLMLVFSMLWCLSACENHEQTIKENIVGIWEWEHSGETDWIAFYGDGTGKWLANDSFTFTYQVENDTITISSKTKAKSMKKVRINTEEFRKSLTCTLDGQTVAWVDASRMTYDTLGW